MKLKFKTYFVISKYYSGKWIYGEPGYSVQKILKIKKIDDYYFIVKTFMITSVWFYFFWWKYLKPK